MSRKKLTIWIVFIGLAVLIAANWFYGHRGEKFRNNSEISPVANFDRSLRPLIFTKHARCRMDCRDISEAEIAAILKDGVLNLSKSQPNSKPDPKYAVEGYSKDGQHLRVIFAPARRGMVVITCIDLEKEWKCNCS